MPVLKVRTFPDPVLRKVSEPVIKIDSSVHRLVQQLIDVMRRQPGGIGIAAPQLGVLKRVAIVDVSRKINGAKTIVLINPAIKKLDRRTVFREGCMSLPDFTANVNRSEWALIECLGLNGKPCQITSSGLEAICIQHEVDHLNGILFVDRVASLKTDVFRRKRYL
jgi:peptide deformylase